MARPSTPVKDAARRNRIHQPLGAAVSLTRLTESVMDFRVVPAGKSGLSPMALIGPSLIPASPGSDCESWLGSWYAAGCRFQAAACTGGRAWKAWLRGSQDR